MGTVNKAVRYSGLIKSILFNYKFPGLILIYSINVDFDITPCSTGTRCKSILTWTNEPGCIMTNINMRVMQYGIIPNSRMWQQTVASDLSTEVQGHNQHVNPAYTNRLVIRF